ncbi:MAG: hypothetical protein HY825_15520 [Acidobacteria bacterium]|nr:hypothetical protein [Acidobacteriota bacterium]
MRIAPILAVLVGATGCYASHVRDDLREDAATPDASAPDDAPPAPLECLPANVCEVMREVGVVSDRGAFGGVYGAFDTIEGQVIVTEVDGRLWVLKLNGDRSAPRGEEIGPEAHFASASSANHVAILSQPPMGPMQFRTWNVRGGGFDYVGDAPITTIAMAGNDDGFLLVDFEHATLVPVDHEGAVEVPRPVDLAGRDSHYSPALLWVEETSELVLLAGDAEGTTFARWLRPDGRAIGETALARPTRDGCRTYPAAVGRVWAGGIPMVLAEECPDAPPTWSAGVVEASGGADGAFRSLALPCARWLPVVELDDLGLRVLFGALDPEGLGVWTVSSLYDDDLRLAETTRVGPVGRIPAAFFPRPGHVVWGGASPETTSFGRVAQVCPR